MVIICLGIGVAVVGIVFSEAGHFLRHGAAIGLGGYFALKGVSRLKCEAIDVLLASAGLALVVLSKAVAPKVLSPDVPEIVAFLLAVVYAVTGLTFTTIAADQRARRGGTKPH
jgi:hypothetical protein